VGSLTQAASAIAAAKAEADAAAEVAREEAEAEAAAQQAAKGAAVVESVTTYGAAAAAAAAAEGDGLGDASFSTSRLQQALPPSLAETYGVRAGGGKQQKKKSRHKRRRCVAAGQGRAPCSPLTVCTIRVYLRSSRRSDLTGLAPRRRTADADAAVKKKVAGRAADAGSPGGAAAAAGKAKGFQRLGTGALIVEEIAEERLKQGGSRTGGNNNRL
jgi:hypothetical protein